MNVLEEIFNTELLADLLDSKGKHNCGDVFARKLYFQLDSYFYDEFIPTLPGPIETTVEMLEENIFKVVIDEFFTLTIQNNPDKRDCRLKKYYSDADDYHFINLVLDGRKKYSDGIYTITYDDMIRNVLTRALSENDSYKPACELLTNIQNYCRKGFGKNNIPDANTLFSQNREQILYYLEREDEFMDLLFMDMDVGAEKLNNAHIFCSSVELDEGEHFNNIDCIYNFSDKKYPQIIILRKLKNKPYLVLGVQNSCPLSCFEEFSEEFSGGFTTIIFKDYCFSRKFDLQKAFNDPEFVQLMNEKILVIESLIMKEEKQ